MCSLITQPRRPYATLHCPTVAGQHRTPVLSMILDSLSVDRTSFESMNLNASCSRFTSLHPDPDDAAGARLPYLVLTMESGIKALGKSYEDGISN